jgi:hypothetical protein
MSSRRRTRKIFFRRSLLLLDGFSYREMAAMLGVMENYVGVKINRIKALLTGKSGGKSKVLGFAVLIVRHVDTDHVEAATVSSRPCLFHKATASITVLDTRVMDELHTERLILSCLAVPDSKDAFTSRGDSEVMGHWDAPPDANPAETAAVIDLLLAEAERGTAMYSAIQPRDEGTFIGVCDLSDIQRGDSVGIEVEEISSERAALC